MRHQKLNRAEQRAYEGSKEFFGPEIAVTPSMRRKVEDLARWIVAGDTSRVREATRAVVALLLSARG